MRVVFFGMGGVFSARQLETIAAEHEVAAVWQGHRGGRPWWRRVARRMLATAGVRRTPLARVAARIGAPIHHVPSRAALPAVAAVAALGADVLCSAAFPWLLPPALLEATRLGALNLHPSLLPRHRGPLPYFWIYYHDDRETGVTLHWMTAAADAGPVVAREAFPLPRGMAVDRLHAMNAAAGAALWRRALSDGGLARATARAQDDAHATPAPSVPRGARMVSFAAWEVERVWHFLAGLCPRFREPLTDDAGRPVLYARVLGFDREVAAGAPGSVSRAGAGWSLACRGGAVRLA
jgi:methionyl-tRNA formyltransferase